MRPFAKWLVWVSSIATALTGVVYFWMDRMMVPVDEWAVINHPLQPLVLKAHLLVAPLLVFAMGVVAVDHVWKYYRGTIRRARRSGLSAMWPVVPMVLTGYLIQAITHELWLSLVAWAHIVAGAAYMVGLAAHQVFVRRSRLVTLQLRTKAPEMESAVGGTRPEREAPVAALEPSQSGILDRARRERMSS